MKSTNHNAKPNAKAIPKTIIDVIEKIFSQPTAPYRENWVLNVIKSELRRLKVPFFIDAWGNIVAGVQSRRDIAQRPRTALMAHTDHPGFHIVKKVSTRKYLAQWYGGVPPKTFKAAVAIYDPGNPGVKIQGKIISKKFFGTTKKMFHVALKNDVLMSPYFFGAFDFPACQIKGSKIFTRAADDLTGVVIILSTFARLSPQERNHCIGLFTRAEEVGFRGALGLIYGNTLGSKLTAISLEASRQLEGARIGSGPVIRLGDKRTIFDFEMTDRMDKAAAALSKKRPFQVQRRIMNGGTCEASAFNVNGIKSSGIAVPLGNYHNQRNSGKPGPEFVDVGDVVGAIELCVEFFKQMARGFSPTAEFKKDLRKGFEKDKAQLKKRTPFIYEI